MGTIVLTVKRNNFKNSIAWKSLKAYFWKKIVLRIQLQIYKGNAQQVAFTPIKFTKQSYWSKAHHNNFPKENKPWEPVNKWLPIKSHHF